MRRRSSNWRRRVGYLPDRILSRGVMGAMVETRIGIVGRSIFEAGEPEAFSGGQRSTRTGQESRCAFACPTSPAKSLACGFVDFPTTNLTPLLSFFFTTLPNFLVSLSCWSCFPHAGQGRVSERSEVFLLA